MSVTTFASPLLNPEGNDSSVSDGIGGSGKQLCNLAEGYSFVLQSVLGVLAFSTLIGE